MGRTLVARGPVRPDSRPDNTRPVPAYGSPLDNSWTHTPQAFPQQAAAYDDRFGFVGVFLRTMPGYPARMTDGRVDKRTYMGEVPFRQNVNKVLGQVVVSSPGKMPNTPQITAQEALALRQALRNRGYRV